MSGNREYNKRMKMLGFRTVYFVRNPHCSCLGVKVLIGRYLRQRTNRYEVRIIPNREKKKL